jgi:hypothetical protein
MSPPIRLSETPARFLDPSKWAELRAFASNGLLALTYINAPYPDPNCPEELFWERNGSFDRAARCYEVGRDLYDECRNLLIERKLIATGKRESNDRLETIKPKEWETLSPMFATNTAAGRKNSFYDIQVIEASKEILIRECADLASPTERGRSQPKEADGSRFGANGVPIEPHARDF